MAKQISARFYEERKTKNTVRFMECGNEDEHIIGALYVKKEALEELGYDFDGFNGGNFCIEVMIELD